jgi:lysozyme
VGRNLKGVFHMGDRHGEALMTRQINEAGLALIKHFEGLRLDAYQDVAGIWTVGYGHIRGVCEGMHMTEEQAAQALLDDLAGVENAVDSATSGVATSGNEFAAMVALCFNIGSGNFRASTVLRDHRAGDYASAADAFLMWDKAQVGDALQPVAGLTNRRNAERALYLQPDGWEGGDPIQ